ncbi:sodium/proline symporter [Haloarcula sp. JP-L23]|uniref:sodium/proline symporter n=1 Tax=Haloarcula sp. JP-L23 TaxID=2716717 RepID=UPI00140F2805|nr:sodium/proline symporter [Haloarcula sp. JP-L23]
MVSISFLIFVAYVIGLLGIGLYFYLTTENNRVTDYMLGGRDVGVKQIAISDASSLQSGFVLLAWVGVGYTTGLSGLWYAFPITLVHLFVYRFIGSKFRRQSEELGSQTVLDHLALYFQDSRISSWIRTTGVLAIAVFMTVYVGAQIIAVGETVETLYGIDYTLGIVIGGTLVLAYVLLGGFNASVWTDFIQALLAIVAVILLPIVMIMEIGGLSAFISQARAIDPTLVSANPGYDLSTLLIWALTWHGFALGLLGQPHGLMRLQAINSERNISAASVTAVTWMAISFIGPLFIGVAGRILFGEVGNPETVGLIAIQEMFSPWVAGILVTGVLGVILSTTDSMMLVVSADFTSYYKNVLNPEASQSRLILLGRFAVAAVAIIGVILAYVNSATIFAVIQFAYMGLAAAFGIPLVALLWWEKITSEAVFATILMGIISTVANRLLFPDYFPIFSMIAAVITIVLVTYLSQSEGTLNMGTDESVKVESDD